MSVFFGKDNVARKAKSVFIGVNNVAQKAKSVFMGVNNVARKGFESTKLWNIPINIKYYYLNLGGEVPAPESQLQELYIRCYTDTETLVEMDVVQTIQPINKAFYLPDLSEQTFNTLTFYIECYPVESTDPANNVQTTYHIDGKDFVLDNATFYPEAGYYQGEVSFTRSQLESQGFLNLSIDVGVL